MNRLYMAYADNSRDYFTFTFYSKHRANSKQNMEDAYKAYKKHHGYGPRIVTTYRVPDDYMSCEHCD